MTPTLYGDEQSGNCYKVQLLFSHLNIAHEFVPIDILNGETQTDRFRSKNPNAKIPLVELANDQYLTESNAILNFFAHNTELLPKDNWLRAQILSWQFFEQYSHEPFIAVARFIQHYLGLPEERTDEYRTKHEGGYKALDVMEQTLTQQAFLVGNTFTIADISLYAYTHVAHEGGFSLDRYPAVDRWLNDISKLPNHQPMGSVNNAGDHARY
ncbi:MAG: glutathione S-transferase family protein [Gammaproteobacteria bacterium]|nr:glutathione S-transferase family protein [Gammaproteobacteria bacterium]